MKPGARFWGVVLVAVVAGACGQDRSAKAPPPNAAAGASPPARPVLFPGGDRLARTIEGATGSTNCPYVLVDWQDTRSGERSRSAVPVSALLGAVRSEHGLSNEAAIRFLAREHADALRFGNGAAVRDLARSYSEDDLARVRDLLASSTPEQAVDAQNRLESELNALSRRNTGETYGYMAAVLHLLLERGVPCGASCKPGLIYLTGR